MNQTHPISAILLLAAATAPAATVFSTDFDSLPDGSVTTAALNGATTGGIWYLNPNRGASYEIQNSSGDKALLLDDPDSANKGTIQFGGITLATTIDLTVDAVTWDFRTATRRTGDGKGLRYQFYDSTGNNVAATLDWYYSGDAVTLNFGEDSGSSPFTFLNPWDAASSSVRDVSVTFSGSTLGVNFGGTTLAGTVENGVTDIGSLRIYSIGDTGNAAGARGLFLDDITATTTAIPEPSTGILATALLGMGLLRRRR